MKKRRKRKEWRRRREREGGERWSRRNDSLGCNTHQNSIPEMKIWKRAYLDPLKDYAIHNTIKKK